MMSVNSLRIVLKQAHPTISGYISNIPIVLGDSLPGSPFADTDGRQITLRPGCQDLQTDTVVFLICHEWAHIFLRHLSRSKGEPYRSDRHKYNMAADYAINAWLESHKIWISDLDRDKITPLFDLRYQKMSTEDIYRKLPGQQEQKPDNGKGDSDKDNEEQDQGEDNTEQEQGEQEQEGDAGQQEQNGQEGDKGDQEQDGQEGKEEKQQTGSGTVPTSTMLPDPDSLSEDIEEYEELARHSKTKFPGEDFRDNEVAELTRLDSGERKPTDAHLRLSDYFRSWSGSSAPSFVRYNPLTRSTRVIQPSYLSPEVPDEIVVAIDVSISMDRETVTAILAMLPDLMGQASVPLLRILTYSGIVREDTIFYTPSDITKYNPQIGYTTRARSVIEYMAEHNIVPRGIVFLTDGEDYSLDGYQSDVPILAGIYETPDQPLDAQLVRVWQRIGNCTVVNLSY